MTMATTEQQVSTDECGRIRAEVKQDLDREKIAERYSTNTRVVSRHAYGHCACDTDIEPLKYKPGEVTPEECASFRRKIRDGEKVGSIQTTYARDTVSRHANGRCGHDIDEEPARSEATPMDESVCARLRRGAKRGKTYEELAETCEPTADTIQTHVKGECTHDIDEQPVHEDLRTAVPEELCFLVNQLYYEEHKHLGQIMDELDERYDSPPHESTIEDHLYGECSHWNE